MKVKIIVSYDGTEYNGWQIQPSGNTVQGQIENAIFLLTGEKVRVTGSGRTDAGVHAEGQVASFSISTESIPANKFALALNTVLPDDIKVIKSEGAEENFHPTRSAKRKTYVYSMYLSEVCLPLKERYALKVPTNLDVEKMREASELLIGEHDFKAFSSGGTAVKTTVREIYSIKIEKTGIDLSVSITGNGFLYNMVRIIVGTLLKIGEGRAEKEIITEMLENRKRDSGGKTLASKGLKLLSVEYV